MSITYTGGFTFPGSVTPRDGFVNENTGLGVMVESALPSFRVFNLSTLTSTVTSSLSSTPVGVTMISPLTAVVTSGALSSIDYVEVSSGYKTTVSGGSTSLNTNGKNQLVAGDQTSGIAFGCSNTAQTLVRMTSAQAVTTITSFGKTNEVMQCSILKSPGRWIIGGNVGYIYEIDTNGNIVDLFKLAAIPNTGFGTGDGVSSLSILSMAYDNNMLLVGTNEMNFLIDWSTKTIINSSSCQSTNGTLTVMFCAGASGETIMTHGISTNASTNSIFELDFTVQPLQIRDQLYLDFTSGIYVAALSNNYSTGFTIDNSGRVRCFSVATRGTTLRTVSTPTPGPARVTFVNDLGVGASQVLLDTYSQLPATYRVPTGATILELVKVGAGALAQWDCSRYST